VRLALTALVIVLGTGFMAGSFVFTATLTHSLDSLFAQSASGTDVIVQHAAPRGARFGPGAGEPGRSRPASWPRSAACPASPLPTVWSPAGRCC
jgi:putative ABC transport system permease protein